MTSEFSESNSRRICHSTSTSTLLVLSASFNYDNYATSDVLWMTTLTLHSFMRSLRAEWIIAAVSSLLIGALRKTTDKLQRVLNSAARIVSNTHKCDRGLTHFWRSQLYWLDVVDRVQFRVCVQVFRCLHKMAPAYLSTYCQPVSGISSRRHQ